MRPIGPLGQRKFTTFLVVRTSPSSLPTETLYGKTMSGMRNLAKVLADVILFSQRLVYRTRKDRCDNKETNWTINV